MVDHTRGGWNIYFDCVIIIQFVVSRGDLVGGHVHVSIEVAVVHVCYYVVAVDITGEFGGSSLLSWCV